MNVQILCAVYCSSFIICGLLLSSYRSELIGYGSVLDVFRICYLWRGADCAQGVQADDRLRESAIERLRENLADFNKKHLRTVYQHRSDGPVTSHVLVNNFRFLFFLFLENGQVFPQPLSRGWVLCGVPSGVSVVGALTSLVI